MDAISLIEINNNMGAESEEQDPLLQTADKRLRLIKSTFFNAVFKITQLYSRCQFTYPCFQGISFTNTSHNILAAFPYNHHQS